MLSRKPVPVFDQAGLTRLKTRKAGPHRPKRERRAKDRLRRQLREALEAY